MTITDQLNELSGAVAPDHPTSGAPARIWAADVLTVNADGTVDCQPHGSRATKIGLAVPGWYVPTVDDVVLCCDLTGDPRTPQVLAPASAAAALAIGAAGGDLSGSFPNPTVATWGGQSKAQVVAGNPPEAHAASHQTGGTDALTPANIGALAAANDLSDVVNAVQAIDNLGAAFGSLGVACLSTGGPSGGQSFAGVTNLTGMTGTLTVKNPNGARVLFLGGMSAYASASGGTLYTYASINGTTHQIGQFYFDTANVHTWCGMGAYVTTLAQGSYTVQLAAYDANALCYWNGADLATLIAIELP